MSDEKLANIAETNILALDEKFNDNNIKEGKTTTGEKKTNWVCVPKIVTCRNTVSVCAVEAPADFLFS